MQAAHRQRAGRGLPPVAVCISGKFRTLSNVAPYIEARVLRPIRDDADVFIVIDTEIPPEVRTLLRPRATMRIYSQAQQDGFAACEKLIARHEQLYSPEGPTQNYSWVMRYRTDFIPRLSFPAITTWPRATSEARMYVQYAPRGCHVDDQWMLMSRAAARIFSASLLSGRSIMMFGSGSVPPWFCLPESMIILICTLRCLRAILIAV